MDQNKAIKIGRNEILPGESKKISYKISESYLGNSVSIPVHVLSSLKAGPVVFISGGIHGDEMNSIAIINDLMKKIVHINKGILIFIPVVNIFGFQDNSRYLPDRRDLNRCFPGQKTGSLADRLAYRIFYDIITQCDYGIDCHTAAFPRTNFPQLRADLSNESVRKLAESFNAPIIVNSKGGVKTLRSAATKQGCPTIVYESGEVNRFESQTIKTGIKGIQNVLKSLDMIKGNHTQKSTIIIHHSHWVRSNDGGLLRLQVHSGDLVKKGTILAVCQNIFTLEEKHVLSPYTGIIIGLTLRPAIQPGEPVCHIGVISQKCFKLLGEKQIDISSE